MKHLLKNLDVKNAQEAIGKDIRMGRQPWKKIVGVVKDFKTNSLREDIKPLLMHERKEFYGVTVSENNNHQILQNPG